MNAGPTAQLQYSLSRQFYVLLTDGMCSLVGLRPDTWGIPNWGSVFGPLTASGENNDMSQSAVHADQSKKVCTILQKELKTSSSFLKPKYWKQKQVQTGGDVRYI